ncbi:MAG: STAS/SEC14 domain-containing protein [Bacteroidota bacterium]
MTSTPAPKEFLSLELVNGILKGSLNFETLDLATAKAAVAYRVSSYGDKDYPLIIDFQNVKHVTKEARVYLASKEGCNKIKAGAIIVDSTLTKVMANFFLQINKPLVPSKLFTDEESAEKWLSNYKA